MAVSVVPIDRNCVPVPKILVIDVTVVPDVVPDVALLKTYCLHIIRGSVCCPYGPQLCFPSQKILVIDVTVVPDVVPDVALLKTYCLHIIRGSVCCPYGPQLCFLSQNY